MWGGGDGSSDATRGPAPYGGHPDSMPGGAGAAGAAGGAGAMGPGGNGEASDAEMYGSSESVTPPPPPGVGGDDVARGRGYEEEMGWGQDGWENDSNTLDGEEVMDDPFQSDSDSGGGFWGGGGDWGGGGGDWS